MQFRKHRLYGFILIINNKNSLIQELTKLKIFNILMEKEIIMIDDKSFIIIWFYYFTNISLIYYWLLTNYYLSTKISICSYCKDIKIISIFVLCKLGIVFSLPARGASILSEKNDGMTISLLYLHFTRDSYILSITSPYYLFT